MGKKIKRFKKRAKAVLMYFDKGLKTTNFTDD